MSGDPHWHVDIDIYGDDEVTFARATLTAHHTIVTGRGASRPRNCASSDRSTGDAAAVGAALKDLACRLTGESRRAQTPAAHLTAPLKSSRDSHPAPPARRPA